MNVIKCFFVSSIVSSLLCVSAHAYNYRATADLTDTQEITSSVPYIPSDAPLWFKGLWIGNGELSASGWAATNLTTDALLVEINSGPLTNDLALTVDFRDSVASANLLVRICDTNLTALTTNMLVNHATPMALTIDGLTESNLVAVITSTSTNITVQSISISIDQDLDGLDEGEEDALGTSDFAKDSDGDGFNDLYEYLVGTDPVQGSSAPTSQITLVSPADVILEAPSEMGPDQAGYATAVGNGFVPATSFSDILGSNTHREGFAAIFRLDSMTESGEFIGLSTGEVLTATAHNIQLEPSGRSGGAVNLSGSSSWIDIGNPEVLNFSGEISMSVWIRPGALDGRRTILRHGHTTSSGLATGIRINNGSYELYSWRNPARNGVLVSMPEEDKTGLNWVHLVGTCDGSTWRLYRNGELIGSAADTVGGAMVCQEPWIIGALGGTSTFFDGDIDDLGIWSRALNAEEIKRIYELGSESSIGSHSLLDRIERVWTATAPGALAVCSTQIVQLADTISPAFLVPADQSLYIPSNTLPADFPDWVTAILNPSLIGAPSGVTDLADANPQVVYRDWAFPSAVRPEFYALFEYPDGAASLLTPGSAFVLKRDWSIIDSASITLHGSQHLSLLDVTAPVLQLLPLDGVYNITNSTLPDFAGIPSVTDNVDPAPDLYWSDLDSSSGMALKLRLPLDSFGTSGSNQYAADESGNNLQASVNGTISLFSDSVYSFGAYYFNGINSYLNLGNPAVLNSGGDFTLSLWIKPEAFDGLRNIVRHGFSDASGRATGVRINEGRYEIYTWKSPDRNGILYTIPQEDLTGSSWVHLVATCDRYEWKLYRNGEEVGTTVDSVQGAAVCSEPWMIGSREGATRFFKGGIRDICYWSRSMTPGEVSCLYTLTYQGGTVQAHMPYIATDELKLAMPLNDPTNSTVALDRTANSVTGTLYNAEAAGDYFTFNGTNACIDLGNPAQLNFSGDISMSAWIRPSAIDGKRTILRHGHTTSSGLATGFRINNGSYESYTWNYPARDGLLVPMPKEDKTGTNWVHLVATCDEFAWNLYRNGKLIGTATNSLGGAMICAEPWIIGSLLKTDSFYKGAMRGVTIWQRALNADEVNNLYVSGLSNPLDFDEGVTISCSWIARDFSGNISSLGTHTLSVTNAFVDSDGDKLFNQDEIFIGTDLYNIDTDYDALDDYLEAVVLHSNPLSSDTDGDGMPDKWEYDNETGIILFSAWEDPDRDSLYNYDEYQSGTDPNNPDTDADGATDGTELLQILSDPLVADFDAQAYTVLSTINGADSIALTGSWVKDGTAMRSISRSGSLGFNINLASNGTYMAVFSIRQNNPYTLQETFDLTLTVDEMESGRQMFYAPSGNWSEALFVMPPLAAGAHELKLTWWNTRANTFLEVGGLDIRAYGGPDSDTNGVPDWMDSRSTQIASLETPPLFTWTSPLCVEGAGRYLGQALVEWENADGFITNAVPLPGVGDRWYIDVPLLEDNTTPILVHATTGGTITTNEIQWESFDISAPATNAVMLRVGDAMLLSNTSGTNAYDIMLDGATLTNLVLTADAQSFLFEDDGMYMIIPTNSTNAVVAVKAVAASFGGDFLCVAGTSRTASCPELPEDDVVIDYDGRLNLESRTLNAGGTHLTMMSVTPEELRLVARLGDDGPVLDSAGVTATYGDSGSYWREIELYPDGTRMVEVRLQVGNVTPDLKVVLTIFVSGVTFADGTLTKVLTADDFDEDGVCKYYLLQSPGSTTSTCHNTRFYQGDTLIGGTHL